ncbi:hypothetical protein CIN_21360 [Commensalibacter intestini A911]|uniref:Uncharacterized protein n=2 Tax=Commensalibacter intestini TaxID=479936 RepID=G6F3E0_9PROT|nr:hypothetical protein CIN_21360 [Commensalibacter intestini A911]
MNGGEDFLVVRILNEPLSIRIYEKPEVITQDVFNQCVEDEFPSFQRSCVAGKLNAANHLIIGFKDDFKDESVKPNFIYGVEQ